MDTTSRLHDDARGVVVLLALASAVFLVGMLWYVIGVGDAITFKEHLQDSADATAYVSAVYHARGMNMIVMLNLVMSAVLAVIVVLRLLQIILAIGVVIASALAAIPFMQWMAGIAATLGGWEGSVSAMAQTLDAPVKAALTGLNKAADAVAVGMPWVALGRSVSVGMSAPYSSHFAGSLSFSLIPDFTFIPAADHATSGWQEGLNPPGTESSKVDGKRWGLPVMEGEYSDLCTRAGMLIPEMIAWPIEAAKGHGVTSDGGAPKALSWLYKTFGTIIGTFPQLFCDQAEIDPSGLESGLEGAGSDIDAQVDSICSQKKQQWDNCAKAVFPTIDPKTVDAACAGLSPTVVRKQIFFDASKCKKDQTDALNQKLDQVAESSQSDEVLKSVSSKTVYKWAANGNDYFAIWAFAGSTTDGSADRGVSYADWKNDHGSSITLAQGLGPEQRTMVAKAEFYWAVEPNNSGQDYGTAGSAGLHGANPSAFQFPFWSDYAADTMWNPRWRARLRRVAVSVPIGGMAASLLRDVAGKWATYGVKNATGQDLEGREGWNYGVEWATKWMSLAGNYGDGVVQGELEKLEGFLH